MANVALHQLLGASTITRVIRRIKTPGDRLQRFFNMQPDGTATSQYDGKVFQYDVMDADRKIAMGRAPGTGPATRAPQKVGQVTVGAYRAHEQVPLIEERLHRTRALGSQWGTVDQRGQNYIFRQERRLAQLFKNNREFMVSRMLKGSFQIKVEGDNWLPVDTGGQVTVDFQVPAGNKSQLDMLGAGDIIGTSWATVASADIPQNLLDINAAFEELHGYPLRHVWCNSTMFGYVLNNSKLQALGGTANRPFTYFTPVGTTNEDNVEETGFTAVFEGIPWVTWHVYDGGLEVDGTYTKFLADDQAVFLPDPSPDICEMYEGSEIIRERLDSGSRLVYGMTGWSTPSIDPAGFILKELDVCLPVIYIPKAFASGTVVF
jgi:hypothetical protein